MTLETSVGASFVVLRPYVLRKLEEPEPAEPEDELADDGEYEGEYDDEESSRGRRLRRGRERTTRTMRGTTAPTGPPPQATVPPGTAAPTRPTDDNHGPDGPPTS